MAVDAQPGISKSPQPAPSDVPRGGRGPTSQASLRVVAGQPSRANRLVEPATRADGDRLRTARGIVLGLAISLVGWAIIGLLWWLFH